MEEQEHTPQTPRIPVSKKQFKDRHGAIQAITAAGTLVLCGFLAFWVLSGNLLVYDALLYGETLAAFAIAVICSHAYNYRPGSEPPDSLRDKAAQLEASWLHSNFCWEIISVWMTVTPLYCTCATIYISGSSIGSAWDQVHVLVYSMLSLVLSLSVYVIRPSNRAAGYREAYLCVVEALSKRPALDPEDQEIGQAIIKGQQIIAKQDLFDPK